MKFSSPFRYTTLSLKQKGFTLIELLVVIAIIGILASVVLASLNSARARARDAKRLSDLKQIQTALNLYYADYGAYPSTVGTPSIWRGNCSNLGSYGTTGATAYIPNLAPTYIAELPLDPKSPGGSSCYIYQSNGTEYMFLVNQTVEGTVPETLKRPYAPTAKTYAIYTPGASNW